MPVSPWGSSAFRSASACGDIEGYEHLPWRDAFLNAAMLLGGMGPVKTDLSEPGKLFAGLYALYAGLVFIAVTGLLLAPAVHHLMHHAHWDDPSEDK